MKLFKKKKQIINAELSGEKGFAEGQLETGSLTWMFIRKWANNKLNEARISNDSLEKNETQTAALRGRISILKDILALPEQPKKGLLSTRREDEFGFMGFDQPQEY